MMERELRTFGLPEPPADLQAVRDRDGDLYRRCPDGTWLTPAAWDSDVSRYKNQERWVDVLGYASLREVTREQEEWAAALKALGPIKITDRIIDAVSDQLETCGIVGPLRVIARTLAVKALEAAGFEVTT